MMTSLIGSKSKRAGQKGLSLFEVLVSVIILGSSLLVVYRPLLGAVGALYEAETRVKANRVLANQAWALQEELSRTKRFSKDSSVQVITEQDKVFYYGVSYRPISADKKLYEAVSVLSWQSGAIQKSVSRTFYVEVP